MAFEIETKVLYLKDEDLIIESRIKNVDDIGLVDIMDLKSVMRTSVAIFVRDGKRKVLKSRY